MPYPETTDIDVDQDAATQPGAGNAEADEAVEHHDPQADLREAIASRRRRELIEDGVDIPAEDEAKPSDDESGSDSDKADDVGTDTAEGKSETDGEDDDPEVEIKVDGEVEKVRQSEVDKAGGIRALQKERAADKRLQEAARRQKELDERERALAEKEKSGAGDGASDESNAGGGKAAAGKLDRAKTLDLINKINYGDAEEAAEALEEVMAAIGQPGSAGTVDTQAIIREAKQQLRGEEILERFTAPPDKGGFGDLQDTRFGNVTVVINGQSQRMPLPLAAAREEVDRLIQEDGMDPSSWATYEKAGKTIVERLGLRSKSNPTDKSRKHERKRQTDHPRGAGAGNRDAGEKPDNRSQQEKRQAIIAEMQANRQGKVA
jgi:hypothetical protein